MKREALAWGPAVFWALVLFSLSRLRTVPPFLEPFGVFPSELVHLGMYTVLGAGLAFGRRTTSFSVPHLVLIAVGSAYGAIDEWHQSFVPGRTPSVTDWLVDTIGVGVGYLLVTTLLAQRPGATEPAAPGQPGGTEST